MIVKTSIQNEFRDKHKGKLAFILGTGVSLDSVEEEQLKPYVTMAINAAVLKFNNPTYFFTCDGALFQYDLLDYLSKEETTQVFLLHDYIPEENISDIRGKPIEHFHTFHRKNMKDAESWTMRETDEELVFGLSSAHTAAHLLHIMGCDPIVLIGCDCCYSNGVYAYWMLPRYKDVIPKYYWEQAKGKDFASWYIGYKGIGYSGKSDNYQSSHVQYWNKMRSAAPSVNIIDSSCGNTGFSYKTLTEVFDLWGDRTL